uniref:Putative secreted protein n=1 Tax=Ixodes ricinus TaxID=34613 RepID=A0A6B0U0F3_IXORI
MAGDICRCIVHLCIPSLLAKVTVLQTAQTDPPTAASRIACTRGRRHSIAVSPGSRRENRSKRGNGVM